MSLRKYWVSFAVAITLFASLSGHAQTTGDSITVAIEPTYDNVSGAHRLLLGESYRKLWATPVKMRVFRLNKEKGGLKILQRGGGMQTKSLRLQDATGQEWVIRTIQKNPEKVLPEGLRQTVAATIIQDQISAEHPYSAVVVPPLASALNIPHANPEVVYVPNDPAFGEHQKDFADQVFLFEEREPLEASKTDNTGKALDKLMEDNDNSVDQKTVLRARLLDMLLGDWDRHEDQWRWERTKGKYGTVYQPVPRDRDQVFYSTSGVIPWLVSRHLLMAKFQSYEDHIRSINRWNLNARYFDRYFLNGLSQQDWEEQIRDVQSKLTDELLTKSMKLMPAQIYKQGGEELLRKIIARRNSLKQQALKYYRFLAHTVEIPATDKREHIAVTNLPDGKVSIAINKQKKEGDLEQVNYRRTFDPAVTKEIRLYGMGSPDEFVFKGESDSPIKLRLVGGDEKDTFKIDETIKGKGNRYVYDRSDEKNNLPKSGQAHIRTGTDSLVNNYNNQSFKYNFFQPLLLGSYNKDYGLQFIGNFIYQKQGFRKEPYAFRQSLLVNYGFANTSLLLNYNGDFKQVIGNSDLVVNVLSKGPNYTSNFFGLGNNTVFANTGQQRLPYYQNVYNYIDADVRIKHTYNNWIVTAGVSAQYYNGDEDDNTNRFLHNYDLQNPAEKVFSSQGNAGLVGGVTYDSRDKGVIPHRGVYFSANLTGVKALNTDARTYGQIQSEFSFYATPPTDSVIVVAVRTGGGTTLGNASYYQQLKLGGNQNLRGYYIGRFTGKNMVYNNIELRLKVIDFASYILPGTLGVIGFHDVGRVWTPGENSSQWHNGYGGGFYFIPAQLILVQGVVGFSKEGAYPYISAGFRF